LIYSIIFMPGARIWCCDFTGCIWARTKKKEKVQFTHKTNSGVRLWHTLYELNYVHYEVDLTQYLMFSCSSLMKHNMWSVLIYLHCCFIKLFFGSSILCSLVIV